MIKPTSAELFSIPIVLLGKYFLFCKSTGSIVSSTRTSVLCVPNTALSLIAVSCRGRKLCRHLKSCRQRPSSVLAMSLIMSIVLSGKVKLTCLCSKTTITSMTKCSPSSPTIDYSTTRSLLFSIVMVTLMIKYMMLKECMLDHFSVSPLLPILVSTLLLTICISTTISHTCLLLLLLSAVITLHLELVWVARVSVTLLLVCAIVAKCIFMI